MNSSQNSIDNNSNLLAKDKIQHNKSNIVRIPKMEIPRKNGKSDINKTKSPSKTKDDNNISINPSYCQSLTTCRTSNNEQYEHSKLNVIIPDFIARKEKLDKFISEINLPLSYSDLLLENGFDSLEVLISQTKNGVAITYQNLKDIGIKLPGERSKILVHLEEISGNFEIISNKLNIYNNDKGQNSSITLFLEKLNLGKYINNFLVNGYYNIELLFVQMNTRQPITEEILTKDIGIKGIDARHFLLILDKFCKCYVLINKDGEVGVLENTNKDKPCNICSIF